MKGGDVAVTFTFLALNRFSAVLGHMSSSSTTPEADAILLEEGLALFEGFESESPAAR